MRIDICSDIILVSVADDPFDYNFINTYVAAYLDKGMPCVMWLVLA